VIAFNDNCVVAFRDHCIVPGSLHKAVNRES
jgi:hypothetical protein